MTAVTALDWTSEQPTAPGFYWVRDVCNRSKPAVVYVFERAGELVFGYPAQERTFNLIDVSANCAPMEWAGPLMLPESL